MFFFNYNELIKEQSLVIFDSIKKIQGYFDNILILRNIPELIDNRKDYYENLFSINNEGINEEIEIIISKLHFIREHCYEDLDKLLLFFKLSGEDSLEDIKKSDNIKIMLENIDLPNDDKNKIYISSKQNENIRFFIHQVMNILSISKPIFANRIFTKEIQKNEILKDNQFICSKIETNLDQIIKFKKELNNLLTINENNSETIIDLYPVKIQDLINFIEIYSDKLEDFPYSGENFKINLNLDVNTNTISINSNGSKIEEIIDVILNNACEELCNKDIDLKENLDKNIFITFDNDDNNLLITIKDNGRGIANINKIFEPYFTTKANTGGSGIGLAAANRLINSLKGELKVNTKKDEGSSFTISLPL